MYLQTDIICRWEQLQLGDQGLCKQSREKRGEMEGRSMKAAVEAQMPENSICYSIDVCGKKILALLVRGPEPTD